MNNTSWARPTLASARTLWAAVTLVAIIVTYAETASRGPVNPFNFFGYFTIQSNTILTIVAAIAGIAGFMSSGPQARWIVALRSLATVCMVIVGVVYAALLAPLGLEGGAPVPWANWVMHYAGPILVAIDQVPYPFLNPHQEYETVGLYVALIAVTFTLVSLLVVWWSRRRFTPDRRTGHRQA